MDKKDKAMKSILGDKLYKDPTKNFYNVFINYINYWNTNKEIDKFWYNNGEYICKKYAGADTIFSLWTPMSWVIFSLNKLKYTRKDFVKDALNTDDIYSFLEKILPKNDELVIKLNEFATLASHEENVMSVPTIKQNINGKELSINRYRGMCYYDQMPVMLYYLLDGATCSGNVFSKFFEDDKNCTLDNIKEWIINNHLEIFFNNNTDDMINKNNLKDLGIACHKKEKIIDKNRLKIMLEKYIELLKERGKE